MYEPNYPDPSSSLAVATETKSSFTPSLNFRTITKLICSLKHFIDKPTTTPTEGSKVNVTAKIELGAQLVKITRAGFLEL